MTPASGLLALVLGLSAGAGAPEPLLRIQDPALLESSGLAVSARHDGVLWTHADGGTTAEVRAVDAAGETVATVTLAGIDPYDPEALAPGVDARGAPALFLGDIGDNGAERPDVSVFGFAEPGTLGDRTVRATWYRFTYPDGPHDAEALLVHPRSGRFLVVTKAIAGGGVYRAPRDPVTADEGTNALVRVGDAPSFVTDGAYLADGRYALRTYASVFVYDRRGREVGQASLPPQPQGESLAVDGDRLLAGSEGRHSAVYAVEVPGPPGDGAAARTAGSDRRPGEPGGEDGSPWRTAARVARAVAIVVVLVALVGWLRRTRRRR
jgi:hypothetical protein